MLRLTFFCLTLLVASCSNTEPKKIAIFNYNDFGPQVIANEVIGQEWWQWQPHGDSRPRNYDIKVIVYRNATLAEVKKLYSVKPQDFLDYRYLEYDKALSYLEEKIEENIIDQVTNKLKKTKKQIIDQLGQH